MNTLEFIASVISSVSWPVAIVIGAIVLRDHIGEALKRLGKITAGGVELSFANEKDQMRREATAADLSTDNRKLESLSDSSVRQLLERGRQIAFEDPETAITLAWTALETTVRLVEVRMREDRAFRPKDGIEIISALRGQGTFESSSATLIQQLRKVRNAAIHQSVTGPGLTFKDADEFIAFSTAIISRLESTIARVKR